MWEELRALHERAEGRRIADLFEADRDRATRFSAETDGLRLDYSKTQIDDAIRAALIALCDRCDLAGRREALFTGAEVNETEHRAALHTALRALDGGAVEVDGVDVMPQVRECLSRMEAFAEQLRDGTLTGSGGRITDVVSIGIGGSDVGPAMAVRALAPYHDGPRMHFVSNVDGAHIADTLRDLDPKTTWVNVASKAFTTVETMTNAHSARDWMTRGGGDPARQFSAISTAPERVGAFGIQRRRVFGFADWVGGRFSVWGPIGLPLMIAIGPEAFRDFLRGGQAMDRHFRGAAWALNLPVLLALSGLWHSRVCDYPTRAVLPYDQRLARLPVYLQQLEMESNGKSVAMDGRPLEGRSGPIVWGHQGTNGQHAFFQLLHQGSDVVPCEFLIAAQGHEPELAHHHRLLVANCLAQSKALMRGRSLEEAREMMAAAGLRGDELERQARHRVFPGNRPSVTISYAKLTPFVLGQIIALYEHRVFVEGAVLGLNSFDQFGVELGKEMATSLAPVLEGSEPGDGLDGSTAALVAFVRRNGG